MHSSEDEPAAASGSFGVEHTGCDARWGDGHDQSIERK